ncbi:uncharacterized protein LOC124289601 isoform X3 [Haliotis rubra]|uniref:uncharacterized protein LOC124289601 isoform X3 n=1 Tax=Haliotis rubra TaxID=36100 RepID=UPI001EE53CE1|nr:uncharacterized protein LOC124289601 isoform X3 [Haliotis rubra]
MERQDVARLGNGFPTSDNRYLQCVNGIAPRHTCNCRHHVNICVVVCVLLTLTTLSACLYTVVCSRQVTEQVILLHKLQTLTHNGDSEYYHDSDEIVQMYPGQRSSEEGRFVGKLPYPGPPRVRREIHPATKKPKKKRRKNQNGRNGKKGSKKGGGKFCKRLAKCQPPPSPSVTAPTPPKTHSPRASHFTVDGSFVSGQTIGSLHPAPWINAHVTEAAISRDSSLFVVESGVYLVYTSVLFNDTKFREGLLVTRNDVELFKCFDGVDYIDHSKERKQNFKFKTCSVSGIAYLSKGDNLRLVNLYPNTNIDVSKGSTFIGLVQLIPSTDPN